MKENEKVMDNINSVMETSIKENGLMIWKMIQTVHFNLLPSQSTKVELKMASFMVKEKWSKLSLVNTMKEIILMAWNMERVS